VKPTPRRRARPDAANSPRRPKKPRTFWSEVKGYAQALAIALFITTFLGTTIGVAGPSMQPTLDGGVASVRGFGDILQAALLGDRLFIPKYETWLRRAGLMEGYRRGDIVIFREKPDSPCRSTARPALLVKRVIGVPGDTVRMEGGAVFVNDVPLDQGFLTENGGRLGSSSLEVTVPEGEYFFLGDNRTQSCDSRIYGTVPFMSVTGRASAVIWPPLRGGEPNWRGLAPPAAFAALE
jgi:signal peptidase I